MNTATQQASDPEKKVWVRPVLMRLAVGETASKTHPCPNDAQFPGAPQPNCDS